MVSVSLLNTIEHIIHLHHVRNEYIIHYFILKFRAYFLSTAPLPVVVASTPTVKRTIMVKKTKKQLTTP